MTSPSPHLDLSRGPLPIVAWIGPGGEQITAKTMADLAAAHFNLSLSAVTPEKMCAQLDLAHAAGIRLIIGLPGLRVGPGSVTPEWKTRFRKVIAEVRSHPGLYGYYIADEPRLPLRRDVAEAMRFFAEEDPDHLPYCNHWTVNMSYAGYRSYEEMWELYAAEAQPWFVSVDGYPFQPVSEAQWTEERAKGNPCYFPRQPYALRAGGNRVSFRHGRRRPGIVGRERPMGQTLSLQPTPDAAAFRTGPGAAVPLSARHQTGDLTPHREMQP